MGPVERRVPGVRVTAVTGVAAASASADATATMTAARIPAASGDWETRLPAALRLVGVPTDVQVRMIAALGAVGVESEFFLRLLRDFPGRGPHTRAQGAVFLAQLTAWADRLIATGAALEAATQGYLAALDAAFPQLRALSATAGDADVWWTPLPSLVLGGEPLELRLRRCGFAYRHVAAVRLASTVETVAEQLAQVLQALLSLPPAGVLPAVTLYAGLSEMTATLQGYLIPYHLMGRDTRTPGLLPAIVRLRQLDASDTPTVASDIAWARAQYATARAALMQSRSAPSAPARRATARPALPLPGMLRDWQATLAALEWLAGSEATAARASVVRRG